MNDACEREDDGKAGELTRLSMLPIWLASCRCSVAVDEEAGLTNLNPDFNPCIDPGADSTFGARLDVEDKVGARSGSIVAHEPTRDVGAVSLSASWLTA